MSHNNISSYFAPTYRLFVKKVQLFALHTKISTFFLAKPAEIFFASLKKIKKHGFNFLKASKSSKNMNIKFRKLKKKLQKHGFNFCKLKGGVFFGQWNELFWQNRLSPSIIVVWPRELMRLIGNCLENIFIMYHMVIRRLEKFLPACEVQLEIFDF